MTGLGPRIIGTGYCVPGKMRLNDDPIFAALRAQPQGEQLFTGYNTRHVLSDDETLVDIMRPAAEMAMQAAGVTAADIDIVIGDGSLGASLVPNDLSRLHQVLGLPPRCLPLPIANAFSQFNAGVMMGDALIRSGRARLVLIALGDSWTRFVDYATPQSVSAADGAAACVMGKGRSPGDWAFVDMETLADTSWFGSMLMAADPTPLPDGHGGTMQTHPYFHIEARGMEGFKTFGLKKAPEAVFALLKRNGVSAADICLITHQASAVLMQAWAAAIRPGLYVDTIGRYANVVQCSVALNLAWAMRHEPRFMQRHVVTLCLGPDMHASAMLLRRGA